MDSKGTRRAILADEQAQEPELWSEEDCALWSKETRGKKGFSKGNESFRKCGFRTNPPEKGSRSDSSPHNGKGKDQKGNGKEGAYPQSGFSASENPVEEGQGYSWESHDWYSSIINNSSTSTTAWYKSRHTAWMASVLLDLAHHPTHVVLDLGCTRSMGSRTLIRRFQKHVLYYGITTEFSLCNKSFVFANSEVGTCLES